MWDSTAQVIWENKVYKVLSSVVNYKVSDIHIREKLPLYVRTAVGDLKSFPDIKFNYEDVWNFLKIILPKDKLELLLKWKEIDAAYQLDRYRFRINVFLSQEGISLAMRKLASYPYALEDIQLDYPMVKKLLLKNSGLILVTWPTGSGKSTTLSAMVDFINEVRKVHILTLEDPIEYLYKPKKSLITQRQIGKHSENWQDALKYAMRQDPDVIMVGEMRDLESISSVLTLVETGHLVLSTLHTIDAVQTISRIIDVFPPYQQNQVAVQLSMSLTAVISQKLFPKKDETGRVAAREIMINNRAIANLIREKKLHQIFSMIEMGQWEGMNTMDQSLAYLVARGEIDINVALPHVRDMETFKLLIDHYKNWKQYFRPAW